MDISNLHIIGTSHISKQSIKEVSEFIEDKKPRNVCLELDIGRLKYLMSDKKGKMSYRDIRKIGLKGFIFSMIGAWGSKKLGKLVGTSPGDEMVAAAKLAAKHRLKIHLIDQNVQTTLKRFSKELTWKEKFQFVKDLIQAPFKKKKIPFDLSTTPSEEIVEKLIQEVKDKYPNVYKVLIEERNRVMARNLAKILKKYPEDTTLAIIGAGHKKEIIELLKNKFE